MILGVAKSRLGKRQAETYPTKSAELNPLTSDNQDGGIGSQREAVAQTQPPSSLALACEVDGHAMAKELQKNLLRKALRLPQRELARAGKSRPVL